MVLEYLSPAPNPCQNCEGAFTSRIRVFLSNDPCPTALIIPVNTILSYLSKKQTPWSKMERQMWKKLPEQNKDEGNGRE